MKWTPPPREPRYRLLWHRCRPCSKAHLYQLVWLVVFVAGVLAHQLAHVPPVFPLSAMIMSAVWGAAHYVVEELR